MGVTPKFFQRAVESLPLENVLEDALTKVKKALRLLNVPTRDDVDDLEERLQELEEIVVQLRDTLRKQA